MVAVAVCGAISPKRRKYCTPSLVSIDNLAVGPENFLLAVGCIVGKKAEVLQVATLLGRQLVGIHAEAVAEAFGLAADIDDFQVAKAVPQFVELRLFSSSSGPSGASTWFRPLYDFRLVCLPFALAVVVGQVRIHALNEPHAGHGWSAEPGNP